MHLIRSEQVQYWKISGTSAVCVCVCVWGGGGGGGEGGGRAH